LFRRPAGTSRSARRVRVGTPVRDTRAGSLESLGRLLDRWRPAPSGIAQPGASVVAGDPGATQTVEDPLTAVPAAALLRSWIATCWQGGCQVDELTHCQALTVYTLNSVYHLVVQSPDTGEVTVRGGSFIPDWQAGRVAGCSLGGCFLKLRGIYPGFRLELQVAGQTILTSPVRAVLVSTGSASTH